MKNYILELKNDFIIKEKKLKKLPYGQAKIMIYEDDTNTIYTLISYTTSIIRICYIDGKTIIQPLTNETHSNTTRKHISYFAKEFNFDYYQFKDIILKGKEVVIDEN